MVNNSVRKPPDSLQILTECLCDDQKMPLLHDPGLREHKLSFKSIPHYKTFVSKREVKVKQGAKERDEAAESAAKEEKKAANNEESARFKMLDTKKLEQAVATAEGKRKKQVAVLAAAAEK